MGDGIQISGGLLLVAKGGVATRDYCCWCRGEQPSLTVTVSGSCADQEGCEERGGTYQWDQYILDTWRWRHSETSSPLVIIKITGGWRIYVDGFTFVDDMTVADMQCVCGLFVGTVEVQGQGDCSGCTATVTF